MTEHSSRAGLRRLRNAALAGVSAATVLLGMTTYRLDRPGLFYDEVHQATGAFAYVGRPTTLFSVMPIWGLPLMNMPYTGAIKTAIYGVYLRTSGRRFSIMSWRLLGIVFSAGGIVAFALLAGHRLSPAALALFFGLLLCDTNFLLQSRHDWGPAALGFFLRMILVGVWLRHQTTQRPRMISFALGLIVGVAIFEKLTAIVLLGPLALMLVSDRRTRSLRDAVCALAGLCVGALPVIASNLYWLATEHTLLVASSIDARPGRSILGFVANYLALGNGGIERRMIFDTEAFRWSEWLEACSVTGLTLIVAAMAWQRGRTDRNARLAGTALLGYLTIAVALQCLPHRTAEQHWIVGTPFQYLAMALASASIFSKLSTKRPRALFVLCLTGLVLARVPVLASALEAIHDDKYSATWDPSLNTAAVFAARQPEHAVFIAANWGIAAQVFCFANGRQNFVIEPYTHYQGHMTMERILNQPERQLAIVAAVRPASPIKPGEINTLWQVTQEVFDNVATTADWEEVPLDPSLRNLRAVDIRLFRRTNGSSR
jgi:hypothetical protein